MSPNAGNLLLNEVAPRLQTTVRHQVPAVGSEDAEELTQDALALAARLLHQAEANGKSVTAGNVAFYALRSAKSGRRSVGQSNADVLGSATQLNGRSRVKALHAPVPLPDVGEEDFLELFESEQQDPSCTAARKLDWAAFLATVEDRARAVLLCVAEGGSLRSVAIRWGVSDSTMQGYKWNLAQAVKEFMGTDVLTLVVKQPAWKSNLVAMRERQVGRAWQS